MGTYDAWIGREERVRDLITGAPAHLLAASLDRKQLEFEVGDELPPVWHWLYFLRAGRTTDVGVDGHPPRGWFLPPVPLPRRMRAGGQFEFRKPLHIGDTAERLSRIVSVEEKVGASGPLVFVRIQHEISANGTVAVVEQESIVYREAPTSKAVSIRERPKASAMELAGGRYTTSEVLLFRFSALTFNCHRIHYDRPYAVDEEGYPGLVVQGPLIALLMLEHLHTKRSAARLKDFRYRAVSPIFCGDAVTIDETFNEPTRASRVVAQSVEGQDAVVGDAEYAT